MKGGWTMRKPKSLTFRIGSDGPLQKVTGRDAWALAALMDAGGFGVTPIDTPAPRWSGYVHNLRRVGVPIETIHEKHGGPYAGTHARYVLTACALKIESLELCS